MEETRRYTVETEFLLVDGISGKLEKIGLSGGLLKKTLGMSLLKTQEQMGALAQKARAAAAGVAATAGRLAAGEIVGAAKSYAAFEDAITAAGAKFGDLDSAGATFADDLDALQEKALEVSGATKFTAGDAAGALDKMAMAGLTARQSMGMLMGTANMAAAAGIDLTSAVDMATDSLGMFGMMKDAAGEPLGDEELSASMDRIADVVAKTTNMANLDMGMWFEAAKQGASAFTSFGGSLEEFSAAAGILANSGVKGSAGGTAIRNIMLGLAGTTGPAQKALAALGVEVYDAGGKMKPFASLIEQLSAGLAGLGDEEKAAYLSDLFGKENISPALLLVNEGADRLREFTSALEASGGAAAKIAGTLNGSVSGQITLIGSAIDTVRIKIGKALAGAGGIELLGRLREFVSNFDPAPMVGAFSAAFGKIGQIVSGVIGYLKESGSLGESLGFSSLADFIRGIDVEPVARGIGRLVESVVRLAEFVGGHTNLVFGFARAWLLLKGALAVGVGVESAYRGFQFLRIAGGGARSVFFAVRNGALIASKSLGGMAESAAIARQAAGPLGRAFGTVFTGIGAAGRAAAGALASAGGAVASFFSATVAPLLMNPVTWIVVGVAALIALVVACVSHWETWGRTVSGAIGIVIPPLNILMGVIRAISERWDGIAAAFRDGGFAAGLSALGDAIRAGMLDALSSTVEILREIPVVGEPVAAIFEGMARNCDLFLSGIDGVLRAFSEGGFVEGIKAVGGAILSLILSPIEAILSALGHIPGIGDWIEPAAAAIAEFRNTLVGFGNPGGGGAFVARMPGAEGSDGGFVPTVSSARAERYSRSESVSRSEVELRLAAGLEPSAAAAAPGVTIRRHHSGGF